MQPPPRVPLLWKLCNFTRFARLVWGRSKCSPSFLIQVYPLLDRKPNAEATVAASAVITIPTCHISWVLSHLSHVTYVWHMSHVTYGPSHIWSTHIKGTRGGGCICVWFSILWRVQLNKEAGRALRHCDLAYIGLYMWPGLYYRYHIHIYIYTYKKLGEHLGTATWLILGLYIWLGLYMWLIQVWLILCLYMWLRLYMLLTLGLYMWLGVYTHGRHEPSIPHSRTW